MLDDYAKANLALWNEWTEIHQTAEMYDLKGFKAGKNALKSLELEELGPEVAGRSLLHLQCHFGLDTLSWARLGATVTGVDFSDKAIALARGLSAELAIPATFVQSRIEDLESALNGEFDIVFTSYGAIEWLRDLDAWARLVAHFLKPGGTFYMAEIHPFAQMLEDTPGKDVRIDAGYFPSGEPERFDVEGSYADREAAVTQDVCSGFTHTVAQFVSALTGAGLHIEYLHEFPFSVCPFWPWMEKADDGWYYLPGGRRDIPFTYSIRATKPA
jgi:SAM-dependent methyltransferase